MAREPIPGMRSVFLAGPSSGAVRWRDDALAEIDRQLTGMEFYYGELAVLSPESRGGRRARHYRDQFEWETRARYRATVVMFWIPRDLSSAPGFTTNVEFGVDVSTRPDTVVAGLPLDCPNPERNRYLEHLANIRGAAVKRTLSETVAAALQIAARVP
ncbi:hypothetical protein AOZ06_13005 [Kibdelosporangium phytohabitans]|uniref:Nucleoside 2-deoxyribosyltransferase n=2 Tax=Kibdelosporangium phytohabitans TaxID=860235 RepID=A0A0N9IGY8_9PSEU|nr:hypothetical protein AOZ06_12685 [Kibdelosporangium phytohabitans]ALG14755.1 hypothetical protein AOZ06_13005 [Kibdelosporangium phytohabitans]